MLEGLPFSNLMTRLESATSREVSNEAVVSITRAFMRSGRQDLVRRLLQVLCRRVAGRTERHLDVWGVQSKEAREDITQDILRMLLESVLILEPNQEFWESRFWTCFDRRTRSLLRNIMHARDELSLHETAKLLPQAMHATPISIELQVETELALEALPEPIRTAFYLRYYAGYKEGSAKSDEVTIASILGVTGRTVRNYLQQAEKILVDWRENHALS